MTIQYVKKIFKNYRKIAKKDDLTQMLKKDDNDYDYILVLKALHRISNHMDTYIRGKYKLEAINQAIKIIENNLEDKEIENIANKTFGTWLYSFEISDSLQQERNALAFLRKNYSYIASRTHNPGMDLETAIVKSYTRAISEAVEEIRKFIDIDNNITSDTINKVAYK